MVALITFLSILVLSLLVVRVVTVALTLTGLSPEVAKFQARSVWTGTGFTTAESEQIVKHPVRRRIVSLLMVIRNAGFVTAVATPILSFADAKDADMRLNRILVIALVLALLWLASLSRWLDRRITQMIRWSLLKWTDLDARDYSALLHLTGDYSVAEISVERGDWLCDRTLIDLDLPEEGVLVLAIQREDGGFLGAPRGAARINASDTVIVYARRRIITQLVERPAGWRGEAEHQRAVDEQRKLAEKEVAGEIGAAAEMRDDDHESDDQASEDHQAT